MASVYTGPAVTEGVFAVRKQMLLHQPDYYYGVLSCWKPEEKVEIYHRLPRKHKKIEKKKFAEQIGVSVKCVTYTKKDATLRFNDKMDSYIKKQSQNKQIAIFRKIIQILYGNRQQSA